MESLDFGLLDRMRAAVIGAPDPYRPSPFWTALASTHMRQLRRSGPSSFKRTVNVRYFNWRTLSIVRHQFGPVAIRWLAKPSRAVFSARLLPAERPSTPDSYSFNPLAAMLYAVYVAMLVDVLERDDPRRLLERLDEPHLGDPILIRHRGRDRSQDLCNSVHEFYRAFGDLAPADDADIAEVGAGYGRLAWVALSELPRATYCVIDLPPALYLSQQYLTTMFPDRSAFRFREFGSYEEIRDEFEAARLRFLLPHQAALLPQQMFDRIVTISTLHEMTAHQVASYFALFDRLGRDRVYVKQWRTSWAINGVMLREHEYPVPAHWRTIYHRQHPIQSLFFEALYAVR